METILINGRSLADEIEKTAAGMVQASGVNNILCDILVGEDALQEKFVEVKRRAAMRVGLGFELVRFSASVDPAEVLSCIDGLNNRADVCGVVVQMPLPFAKDISENILNTIGLQKDVDCLSIRQRELFYQSSRDVFTPPTAMAVVKILESIEKISLSLKYLIVGQGGLVGRPVHELFKRLGLQVATMDEYTEKDQAKQLLFESDVVVTGAGRPNLISGDALKPGVVVIDAGTSEAGGMIVGDVNKETVVGKASFLSPVPGGVGPVSVACLMMNCALYKR